MIPSAAGYERIVDFEEASCPVQKNLSGSFALDSGQYDLGLFRGIFRARPVHSGQGQSRP